MRDSAARIDWSLSESESWFEKTLLSIVAWSNVKPKLTHLSHTCVGSRLRRKDLSPRHSKIKSGKHPGMWSERPSILRCSVQKGNGSFVGGLGSSPCCLTA